MPTPEPARFRVQPAEQFPPTVAERAAEAGQRAEMAFRFNYAATLEAHDNERDDDQPAAWLKDDPCPAWCVEENHKTSDHPDDRAHYGATAATPLVTMEPTVLGCPTRFAPPELTASLDRKYREREARVYINDSGDHVRMQATLDEAEKFAHDILDLVRQARGLTPLSLSQFDADGRCPDMACRHCAPLRAEQAGGKA